jgi:hypothetical protein
MVDRRKNFAIGDDFCAIAAMSATGPFLPRGQQCVLAIDIGDR